MKKSAIFYDFFKVFVVRLHLFFIYESKREESNNVSFKARFNIFGTRFSKTRRFYDDRADFFNRHCRFSHIKHSPNRPPKQPKHRYVAKCHRLLQRANAYGDDKIKAVG